MTTDVMLTTSQVADHLGVTLKTVWRYLDAGKLPSTKTPGGQHRIRASDLAPFLGERTERREGGRWGTEPAHDDPAQTAAEHFRRLDHGLYLRALDERLTQVERLAGLRP